jgi:hypothetical protein
MDEIEEIIDTLGDCLSDLINDSLTWERKRDMIMARIDSIELEEFVSWFDNTPL